MLEGDCASPSAAARERRTVEVRCRRCFRSPNSTATTSPRHAHTHRLENDLYTLNTQSPLHSPWPPLKHPPRWSP